MRVNKTIGIVAVLAAVAVGVQVSNSWKARSTQVTPSREADQTGGEAAMEYRFMMRRGSDGKIPPRALLNAKKEIDALPVLGQDRAGLEDDAGIGSWNWIGPGNIGGRCRSILFTGGQTMWVGGVSGGLWKSTDLGNHWSAVNDFWPSLQVTSIARDCANGNIMYAATGEGFSARSSHVIESAGVLRSFDGGVTWVDGSPPWKAVTRVVAHPVIAGRVYCTVSDDDATVDGVWRSDDNGSFWVHVLTCDDAKDIKIGRLAYDNVLVGTQNAVWLSHSKGDPGTWEKQTVGGSKLPADTGRCEVSFGAATNSDETMWVSMNLNNGEIWRSTDGGTNWHRRNTGTNYFVHADGTGNQGNYDNALWASPDDPNLVVVGGIKVWRSTNGGSSFAVISNGATYFSAHDDVHAIVEGPGYGGLNRNVFFATDGGIFQSSNIYLAQPNLFWSNLNYGLGVTQFYAACTMPDGSVIFGGTQDNSTPRFKRADGALSWFYSPVLTDGGWCLIDPTNSNRVWITSQFLGVYRSDDGGATFDLKTSGLGDYNNDTEFIAPLVGSNIGNQFERLYAGGRSLWQSQDGGDSWFRKAGPFMARISTLAADATGLAEAIVGCTNGDVFTVSGATSTQRTWTGKPLGRAVTDIAVEAPNHYYVTFGGYTQTYDSVWYTSDGGTTWQNRSGSGPYRLPSVQINAITFHPDQHNWLYVATDLGILSSEDAGQTWNRSPWRGDWQHDGPVNTEVDDFLWHSTNVLVAVTHGRGMFESRIRTIVYVDKFSTSSIEDGSIENPYKTINKAEDMSGPGVTFSIKAGTYIEARKTHSKRFKYASRDGIVQIR